MISVPVIPFWPPVIQFLMVMWQNAGAPNWREHVVSVTRETWNGMGD
jgi:hypothetical protein